MSIIHPFQSSVSTNDGTLVFTVVKNTILAFRCNPGSWNYSLAGSWVDTLDRTNLIKEKVIKEQQRQLAENAAAAATKKSKSTDGEPVVRSVAKVPTPGTGAPPIYSIVRNLLLSRDNKMLFACADSDKSILVLKIDTNNKENCLTLVKRQPYPKRPNAIATTEDNEKVIMVDKFGDAFEMIINEEPKDKINEFEPILGHVSMLTDVMMKKDPESGKQFIITSDRDEHIKVSHYPQCFIIDKWLFGHEEFVSTLCDFLWDPRLLVSAGGDNYIFLWDWISGKSLFKFDYSELIQPYLTDANLAPARFQNETNDIVEYAVSKVVSFANLPYIAFFVEATKALVILKINKDDYSLSLFQIIELPCNLISLFANTTQDELLITLDNRESSEKDFIKFVAFNPEQNKFVINEDKGKSIDKFITDKLKNNENVTISSKDDVYPLYNIANLKKHGEAFS
ncbi:Trm82p NDAI_0J00810 [Naumovozyma dairenensis CBS 421]|uniref:Uncharacterized protein n=1 Tax=Naumovozyma dairenensis (strain ATCC 10597 / BCRC 20456 / CBS 421 / NBRC 0211 / NRRL Y-12639) TaxID=1071378 RepID=G0WGP5_NAUDC|nr:hypothetical protein NDAI_0J00810 [Naumovozyma dairenensis CBS 421]CCD26973.1 hypothetical protein NDAI_0J00810 [Naumovozyma dairenensis CBS 421]